MVQPAVVTDSTRSVQAAARGLETPREVRQFISLRTTSLPVAAFLLTEEWAAIYRRIVGDGRVGPARDELDVARFLRQRADDATGVSGQEAYLHAVAEIEALATRRQVASTARPAPPNKTWGRASFGEALAAVKTGWRVMRAGWPDGMFVVAQAGYPGGIGINANTAAASGLPEGTEVVFPPYLVRVQLLSDGRPGMARWAPTDEDVFAEDWQILPQRGSVVRSGLSVKL